MCVRTEGGAIYSTGHGKKRSEYEREKKSDMTMSSGDTDV